MMKLNIDKILNIIVFIETLSYKSKVIIIIKITMKNQHYSYSDKKISITFNYDKNICVLMSFQ